MFATNKNATSNLELEEMEGKVEEVKDPVSLRSQHHRWFAPTLLIGCGALICVSSIVITWAITRSVHKADPVTVSDISAANYMLSKMNLSADPCTDFFQYSCGTWNSEQTDAYILTEEQGKSNARYMSYFSTPITADEPVLFKNVKILWSRCLGDHKAKDTQQINDWISSIFSMDSEEEIVKFSATIGSPLFVRVTPQPLRTELFNSQRQDKDLAFISEEDIKTYIRSLPEDLGQEENILQYQQLIRENFTGSSLDDMEKRVISKVYGDFSFYSDDVWRTLGVDPDSELLINEEHANILDKWIDINIQDPLKFTKVYAGIMAQHLYRAMSQAQYNSEACDLFFVQTYFGFVIAALVMDREGTNYTGTLNDGQQLTTRIKDQYIATIEDNGEISESGRRRSIDKVKNMQMLIGYPEWISNQTYLEQLHYSESLTDDMPMVKIFSLLESHRQRQIVLQDVHSTPVDPWLTVFSPHVPLNAVYNYQNNAAGVPLKAFIPPYYAESWPWPMKYGAIGSIIAHEMTHGFDEIARESEQWSKEDLSVIKLRQECLVDQYNQYGHYNGLLQVNGTMTFNENVADNVGVQISYKAHRADSKSGNSKFPVPGVSLTSDQMFFISFAQMRCFKYTQDNLKRFFYGKDQIYSPPDFRAIGSIENTQEFFDAFSCSRTSERMCKYW